MAKVRLRGKDGRIISVNPNDVTQLIALGYTRISDAPHAVSGGSGGPIVSTFPQGPLPIGSPGSFGGSDNEPAPIGAPGSFGGSSWEPEMPAPTRVVPTSQQPFDHFSVTGADLVKVDALWASMMSTAEQQAIYWDMRIDPETGQTVAINMRPQTPRDLENSLEEQGWTDNMIGMLIGRYKDRTGGSFGADQAGALPFDTNLPGGGGGGGGGGRIGPVYIGVDRRTIEDNVKAQLLTYTGEFTDQRVAELADQWEAAHRQDWEVKVSDAGGTSVDPNQKVLDSIREQADYKKAHALRGDADDEARWIGDRRMRLTQLGVSSVDADDRAIRMAQIGTGIGNIETGAFQNSKGREDITLMNQLAKSAELVAGAL